MGQPCLRRGNDYVVSAGDAELVSTKLSSLRSGRKPVEAISLVITPSPSSTGLPVEWQPRAGARMRDWQAIVVHHAAMPSGDADSIHRVHLANPGWDGLGYHFVVGNGTQSGDGEVEVGFRWREQREGAHARARKGDDNRWNLHSIGICLIGKGEGLPVRRSGSDISDLSDSSDPGYITAAQWEAFHRPAGLPVIDEQ